MSSSARPRQSATGQRPNRGPAFLPVYQPPTNPLNEAAQRALHDLPRTHNLANLTKHLQIANDTLTNAAGDVNDRYQRKAVYQQKQNARRAAQGNDEEDDEGNRAVEEMREKVDEMTSRMEESVRKVIDARAIVASVELALRELDTNVAAGNGAIAPTQSTLGASQFRQRRRVQGEDADSEDESSQEVIVGPTSLLKRKITEQQTEYEGLSMRDRYATNNNYIGFKQMVHDSLHPGENAPPVPHASTWFPQPTTEATPGGTKKAQPAAADDDDFEIASERINIKCPLTLLPMKNPVTSKKCPHSFEKEAIVEMISLSATRIGGGSQSQRRGPAGGEKVIKCPVCEVMLAATDLYSDPILLRKIKRIQADQRLQDEDEDSDDEIPIPRGSQRPQAEEIESGDEGRDMSRAARMRSLAPRIKAEKLASSARQVSVVPNSQPVLDSGIVDLEDADEE